MKGLVLILFFVSCLITPVILYQHGVIGKVVYFLIEIPVMIWWAVIVHKDNNHKLKQKEQSK